MVRRSTCLIELNAAGAVFKSSNKRQHANMHHAVNITHIRFHKVPIEIAGQVSLVQLVCHWCCWCALVPFASFAFGFLFFGMVGVMPGKMLLALLVAMAVCVLVFTQASSKVLANVSVPSSKTVANLSDVDASMVLNRIEQLISIVGENKDDKVTILKSINELTGLVNEIKSRQADTVPKNESTMHLA